MGLRGALPQIETTPAPQLADLSAPEWLSAEGKAYWSRNAKWCAENNLLTQSTADSFAMLCDLWARYRQLQDEPTSKFILDTAGKYQSYAKMFRLVPCDKPGKTPAQRWEAKKEFEF